MPWVARVIGRSKGDGTGLIRIELKDGTETLTRDLTIRGATPQAVIIEQVRALIANIEGAYTTVDDTPNGPIDLSGQPTDPDSPEKKAFLALRYKVARLREAVTDGLMAADDPAVTAARQAMQDAYRPEFIG